MQEFSEYREQRRWNHACHSDFCFQPRRSAELIVTRTEPALCTSAPTTGLNTSVVARTVAKKFNPMEKVRFRYANGLMIDMDRVVW